MVRGFGLLKVSIQGNVSLHSRGQVEVVAARDGHVQHGCQVGQEVRVDSVQVVQAQSVVLEEGWERVDPDAEKTHADIVAGEALEEQAESAGAWKKTFSKAKKKNQSSVSSTKGHPIKTFFLTFFPIFVEKRQIDNKVEDDAERPKDWDENSVDEKLLLRDWIQMRIEEIVFLVDAVIETANSRDVMVDISMDIVVC